MSKHHLEPYKSSNSNWKEFIKGKWLLFDSDAIISILSYKAYSLFDDIKELDVISCYIDPVKVELLRTNSSSERTIRLSIINNSVLIPLKDDQFKYASDIQLWLSGIRCFPAPTDLYLAGTLASFHTDNIVLLTANTKDFPYPLFKRECELILQNETSNKLLTFFCIDKTILFAAAAI